MALHWFLESAIISTLTFLPTQLVFLNNIHTYNFTMYSFDNIICSLTLFNLLDM